MFVLDPSRGVATYLQLVQQAEHAPWLGNVKPGDRLPGLRESSPPDHPRPATPWIDVGWLAVADLLLTVAGS